MDLRRHVTVVSRNSYDQRFVSGSFVPMLMTGLRCDGSHYVA